MPIHVICPGCHSRFQVNNKFAGKTGPCPKCKRTIQVPSADQQIVIHAPEHSEAGAKDAAGQHVLKPIERTKTTLRPLAVLGGVVFFSLVMVAAMLVRNVENQSFFLILGAIGLAPPIAWVGYAFLRNSELEAYTGISLVTRTLVCAILYAATWALYSWSYGRFFGAAPLETWNLLLLGPLFTFFGTAIAYLCYDLDWGSAFFHYCLYLLVTIVLRLLLGLPAL